MKRLASWLPLLLAAGLAVLCGLAWKNGLFANSDWQAPGMGLVKGFAGGWVIASLLLFALPRRFARGGLLVALLLTAVAAVGIGPVAAVFLLVAAAVALGSLVVPLGTLGQVQEDSASGGAPAGLEVGLQELVTSLATGLALIAGLTSVTLHFPINTALTWTAALLLLCIVQRRYLKFWFGAVGRWISSRRRSGAFEFGLASLLGLAVTAHLMLALLPEVGFDALAYHLLVPDYVADHGQWSYDFRSFIWAVFPLGAEGIWTVPYLLAGETASRLTNWVSFLALLGGLAVLVRSCASRVWTLMAVVLFASAPLAALEMVTLFTENTLTSFLVTAFALLLVYGRRLSGRGAVAVAVLLGGAMATKLIAVFTVAPLGLWLAWLLMRRHGWGRGLALSSACAVLIAVVGGVAYGYAWWATDNPVFPFFNTVFESEHWPAENMYNTLWQGNLSWDLPWQTVIHTDRFLESQKGGFGFQYLILLPFLLGAVWPGAGRPRGVWLALLVFALAMAGSFSFQQYLRYIYPVLPMLTFVLVVGAARFDFDRVLRGATLCLMLAVIVGNSVLFPAACFWLSAAPFDAAFLPEAELDFVGNMAPTQLLIDQVNLSHGQHARVMLANPAAGAGVEGTALYYSWHFPKFQRAIFDARDVDQLAAVFERYRVTHLIAIHQAYAKRELIEEFLAQHAVEVAALDRASLFRIEPAVAHGPELLVNVDFTGAPGAWTLFGTPAPEIDSAAGVVRLRSGQHLAQQQPLAALGSCYVELEARSLGAPAAGFLTMVWFSADGEMLGNEHRGPHFGSSVSRRQLLFVPPQGASRVTVRFTTFSPEVIELHSLSLRH